MCITMHLWILGNFSSDANTTASIPKKTHLDFIKPTPKILKFKINMIHVRFENNKFYRRLTNMR